MKPINQAELECAENIGCPSYFLQWLGHEAKDKKVCNLQAEFCAFQHPAKAVHENGVYTSGWAPRARTEAEAGGKRVEGGDKAPEAGCDDITGVDRSSPRLDQQACSPRGRAQRLHKLFSGVRD